MTPHQQSGGLEALIRERVMEATTEFIEKGADIEHTRWGNWQAHLHSQCFARPEYFGALIIPADLVARWKRQIETPYSDLSEAEKESDRREVRSYSGLLEEIITTSMTLAYEKGRADRDEEVRVIVRRVNAENDSTGRYNACQEILTALSPDVTKTE